MCPFFLGLYLRAMWLKSSKTHDIVTVTPLRLLSHFFKINAFVPERQPITLSIVLQDPQHFFILDDGATATIKYHLICKTSQLRLLYAIVLPSLRSNFLGSIEKLGIRRSLQLTKNTYKIILKGAQNAKMQNVFQFGVLPSSIVMYMTKSSATYGNWKDIATYGHYDVQTISLFINGKFFYFYYKIK